MHSRLDWKRIKVRDFEYGMEVQKLVTINDTNSMECDRD